MLLIDCWFCNYTHHSHLRVFFKVGDNFFYGSEVHSFLIPSLKESMKVTGINFNLFDTNVFNTNVACWYMCHEKKKWIVVIIQAHFLPVLFWKHVTFSSLLVMFYSLYVRICLFLNWLGSLLITFQMLNDIFSCIQRHR